MTSALTNLQTILFVPSRRMSASMQETAHHRKRCMLQCVFQRLCRPSDLVRHVQRVVDVNSALPHLAPLVPCTHFLVEDLWRTDDRLLLLAVPLEFFETLAGYFLNLIWPEPLVTCPVDFPLVLSKGTLAYVSIVFGSTFC